MPQSASAERSVLQNGLREMQRRSGQVGYFDDEFAITSLDIIIHRDKKLGQGGFACVFEADWKGAKVAVKELEREVSASVRVQPHFLFQNP